MVLHTVHSYIVVLQITVVASLLQLPFLQHSYVRMYHTYPLNELWFYILHSQLLKKDLEMRIQMVRNLYYNNNNNNSIVCICICNIAVVQTTQYGIAHIILESHVYPICGVCMYVCMYVESDFVNLCKVCVTCTWCMQYVCSKYLIRISITNITSINYYYYQYFKHYNYLCITIINSITNITCITNISSIADIPYIPALPQLSIFPALYFK